MSRNLRECLYGKHPEKEAENRMPLEKAKKLGKLRVVKHSK